MKKNMGSIDRVIRLLLAIVIALLYFTDKITGAAAIVLGVFALVFLITSLVGYCPAYALLGIKTHKERVS